MTELEIHYPYIRRAIELSKIALDRGDHPFGAVLVRDSEIVLEASSSVNTDHDPLGHAEINLVRDATRIHGEGNLRNFVLYTSTEPCAMCAGAIYINGINTVVYANPSTNLSRWPYVTKCEDIFSTGKELVSVIGPVLPEEAHAIFPENFG